MEASVIHLIVQLDSFLKKGMWWFEITKERHSRKRRLLFVMNQYSSKDYGYMYMMKKD